MTTKEAIERVRSRFDKWALDNEDLTALQALGLVTAESEDERIRKQLIDAITMGRTNSGISFTEEAASRFIAWLEKHSEEEIQKIRKKEYTNGFNDAAGFGKQKEQKPILKFKVGDKVHLEGDDVNIVTITGIEEDRYLTDSTYYGPILFGVEYLWQIVEQKPAEWSEEEPKQEWSGEDRDILLQTAAILKANFDSDEKFEDCDYDCETLAGKLLEMRYRISPSWKPSEEQMKALERASTNKYLSAEQYDILVSLYENLKKLM